jgi:hypothetical protein
MIPPRKTGHLKWVVDVTASGMLYATLSGISAQKASELFKPTIDIPNKKKSLW